MALQATPLMSSRTVRLEPDADHRAIDGLRARRTGLAGDQVEYGGKQEASGYRCRHKTVSRLT